MDALFVTDLVGLALAHPAVPEARLEKMFDWYFAREIEIVKWSLGVASGIVVGLLPGLVDPNKFIVTVPPRGEWVRAISRYALLFSLLAIGLFGALAVIKLNAISERAGLYVPSLQIILSITRSTP